MRHRERVCVCTSFFDSTPLCLAGESSALHHIWLWGLVAVSICTGWPQRAGEEDTNCVPGGVALPGDETTVLFPFPCPSWKPSTSPLALCSPHLLLSLHVPPLCFLLSLIYLFPGLPNTRLCSGFHPWLLCHWHISVSHTISPPSGTSSRSLINL